MPETTCKYDNAEYSEGSTICSNGRELKCMDGEWVETGADCNDEGASLVFDLESPPEDLNSVVPTTKLVTIAKRVRLKTAQSNQVFIEQMTTKVLRIFGPQSEPVFGGRISISGIGTNTLVYEIAVSGYPGQEFDATISCQILLEA